MAPNVTSLHVSQEESQRLPETSLTGKIKEVLVNGYFYDVTNFVRKHPGGSIIEYYTNHGEDATLAIQQFHQRSPKKISTLLNSFKRRKAEDSEIQRFQGQAERNRSLNEDFTKLYLELEKEGLFKPAHLHNIFRLTEVILLALTGYYFLFFSNWFLKFVGITLIGLSQGRSGWIQHECGHLSLTGNPKADRCLHAIIFGIGLGLSSTWWARGHNRHHAMPQRLKHDVDLDTLPFIAYNARVVNNEAQGKTFFIQNQVYLFLAIDTLLGTLVWQLYLHPKHVLRHGYYFQLLWMCVHYVLAYQIGFWPWLLSTWLMSMYLFGNFSLSHSHLSVTEEPTHWLEYSLIHTADVSPSPWVNWFMGYLNFQIEHHLFPTMPQCRHPLIRDRVKALAEKHHLPYIVFSFPEAVQKTFANLKNVSKELRQD